jgi:hypothetical protein
MQPKHMQIGEKYLVTYRIPGVHRVDRTMVGRFIGTERKDPHLIGPTTYLFSGRSDERHGRGTDTTHAYGTASLQHDWIKAIEHKLQSTPCHSDKKVPANRAK